LEDGEFAVFTGADWIGHRSATTFKVLTWSRGDWLVFSGGASSFAVTSINFPRTGAKRAVFPAKSKTAPVLACMKV
jgi:hypothetical protein